MLTEINDLWIIYHDITVWLVNTICDPKHMHDDPVYKLALMDFELNSSEANSSV